MVSGSYDFWSDGAELLGLLFLQIIRDHPIDHTLYYNLGWKPTRLKTILFFLYTLFTVKDKDNTPK
jgi:hypothetical protein